MSIRPELISFSHSSDVPAGRPTASDIKRKLDNLTTELDLSVTRLVRAKNKALQAQISLEKCEAEHRGIQQAIHFSRSQLKLYNTDVDDDDIIYLGMSSRTSEPLADRPSPAKKSKTEKKLIATQSD